MRKQLQSRLQALKSEFEAGQKMLAELDAKRTNIHETLLRIHGAIQVLEEELAKPDGQTEDTESAANVAVDE
jgi:uncharacterized protein (DUF342 family)